jgi:hypothetical protein
LRFQPQASIGGSSHGQPTQPRGHRRCSPCAYPTQVAVYVNLNPVVAALLGIWLLGERRSLGFALGFAAVVAGVGLVNWPQPAAKDPRGSR